MIVNWAKKTYEQKKADQMTFIHNCNYKQRDDGDYENDRNIAILTDEPAIVDDINGDPVDLESFIIRFRAKE